MTTARWKTVLELGPIVLFFVGYLLLRERTFEVGGRSYEGFIAITAMFVPIMIAATVALWRITGKLSRMQVVTLVLVILFGGLTVWLNDDRFFKMKPTIIYLIFGGILGIGLVQGRSYLRMVMEEIVPLEREGWMKLTRRVMLFFFALAATNEIVWRTMSTDVWVNFKTFGLTAAIFVFFALQGPLFAAHALDDQAAREPKNPRD